MKSNKVFKFTLTAICMAVLSACGSSGGDNRPSIDATNNAKQQQQAQIDKAVAEAKAAAEKAAAEAAAKAAAEKAAAEAAAKAAAEKAAAEKAAADKAAADKAAANVAGKDNVGIDKGFVTSEPSPVGAKNVVLATSLPGGKLKATKSNLNLQDGIKDAVADVPKAMNMDLHPSLDTVVVVEASGENSEKASRGYLEDFDFRGNVQTGNGFYHIPHIYVQNGNAQSGTADLSLSDGRPNKDVTKTDTKAKKADEKTYSSKNDIALVYQDGRVNYTQYSGRVVDGKNGKDLVDPAGLTNSARDKSNAKARGLSNTVAEMYGHLTFADSSDDNRAKTNTNLKDRELANLPLAAEGHSNQLNRVQYGRVTSHLGGHKREDFKDGVVENTFVVNYGLYGQDNTENNYFYRGVGNTTDKQLAALGNDKTFTYKGHAVTYGLDDSFKSFEKEGIPNAVGSRYDFVSGSHVVADVNTALDSVTGSIFNNWYDSYDKKVKQGDLVQFKGDLLSNGAISGKSVYMKDKSTGTFAATLYGDKAQEMGGVVSSNDKTLGKAWGAVFGANRSNEAGAKGGWGASTNVQQQP